MPGSLYYGDNLQVLREYVQDESVDLIYLDPPFNSNATYNVLFKAPSGHQSQAQIEAFEDTWHWGTEAESAFTDALRNARYPDVGLMLESIRRFLRENDMMAYLAMMAARMIELHRVLKPTGSLYLHCDQTASHYLKVLLDAVFDPRMFRNEIVWKRRVGMSSAVHESNRFGICTDSLLLYAKSDEAPFAPQYNRDDPDYQRYISERFTYRDADGRLFQPTSLVNPAYRPNLIYDYRGYKSPQNGWMITKEKMTQWDAEGRLYFPKDPNGRIRRKSYADELRGMPIQNLWSDIPEINSQAQERLGYPTQKPLALLERVVKASSNEGQTILDPFCGCGTAVHAAEKLGRNWIGIDITHLAISLIERRLRDAFPGVKFDVHGTPKDLDGARDLAERDKYQFQWWAVSLVDAVPYGGKKRGADSGIDGWRYMASGRNTVSRCIVSVKGGEHVSVQMVRDLRGVMEREKAEAGLFITLAEPTAPMKAEAAKAGFFDSPFGGHDSPGKPRRHPRMQVMTIESLLTGAKPDLPPLAIEASFRRAEREDRSEQDQGSLLTGMADAPVVAAVSKSKGKRAPRVAVSGR